MERELNVTEHDNLVQQESTYVNLLEAAKNVVDEC